MNAPGNTQETYFDFTEENHARAQKILAKYPSNYKQSGIIPLLDLAQRQHGGWLPVAAMDKVAKTVGVARRPGSLSFFATCDRFPLRFSVSLGHAPPPEIYIYIYI